MKRLCGHGNKHVGKNNKNSNSGSQTVAAPLTDFSKCLAKCKTAFAVVHNNLSEKMEMPTPATIIEQLRSDYLILIISIRGIRSHGSKYISTKSNANSLAKNSFYISTTQYLRH